MPYRETLPRRGIPRRQMMKRVARFSRLKGFDGGLPDSNHPDCRRTLYNVIGFQPPKVERAGKQSPVGEKAARMAAIKISEGFNLGYCRALPGKGPMLHNHDTNETFIAMTGTWRASWENEKGKLDMERVTGMPRERDRAMAAGGEVRQGEGAEDLVAEQHLQLGAGLGRENREIEADRCGTRAEF